MLRRRGRERLQVFLCGSPRDLVPGDHVVARVDHVLDPGWLHGEAAEVYPPGVGLPAIGPEAAVRLMRAGFLPGIVHDRRLIRADVGRESLAVRHVGPMADAIADATPTPRRRLAHKTRCVR
jgi:hypothetical protein